MKWFQIFFGTLITLLLHATIVDATWAKSSGQNNLERFGELISSTTNFDSSKYPTCKANSREKECNVFQECQNVCQTVNKQDCVTRCRLFSHLQFLLWTVWNYSKNCLMWRVPESCCFRSFFIGYSTNFRKHFGQMVKFNK